MSEELFFFTLGALFVCGHTMAPRICRAASLCVSYVFTYSLLARKAPHTASPGLPVFRPAEAAAGTVFLVAEHVFVRRRASLPHILLEKTFVVLMLAGYVLSLYTVFERSRWPRRGKPFASTGSYAYVRHPFYLGILALALGIAVYLTSYVTAVLVLLYASTKVRERVAEEEAAVARSSPAYAEYQKRVPSGFFV